MDRILMQAGARIEIGQVATVGTDGLIRPAPTAPRSPLLSRPRTEKQDSDEYKSPRPLFDKLDLAFGRFTLDVAASDSNHLLPEYLTKADDAPSLHVGTHVCWNNPPYSRGNLKRFLRWAQGEVQRSSPLFCNLVPSYTSEGWWTEYVKRQGLRPIAVYETVAEDMDFVWRRFADGIEVGVHFVDGRLSFCEGEDQKADTARYASSVVIFRRVSR